MQAITAGIDARIREIELQRAKLNKAILYMRENKHAHFIYESDCPPHAMVRALGHYTHRWRALRPVWDAWTRAHGISMWTEVTPTQTLLYLQWLTKWLQATTNSTLTQL